jgi:hypothetical protein
MNMTNKEMKLTNEQLTKKIMMIELRTLVRSLKENIKCKQPLAKF